MYEMERPFDYPGSSQGDSGHGEDDVLWVGFTADELDTIEARMQDEVDNDPDPVVRGAHQQVIRVIDAARSGDWTPEGN